MDILERTTTEEYDEDGRLTSRTTVEKYRPGADDEPFAEYSVAELVKLIGRMPLLKKCAFIEELCKQRWSE